MPQKSKYQTNMVEKIMDDILSVLEKHNSPTDLSLMVLGNIITSLLDEYPYAQKEALTKSFSKALYQSIQEKHNE